ncbi:ATP-dependent RNA helicase DHX30-like isoform X2 [Haemaphysalis longicornis]
MDPAAVLNSLDSIIVQKCGEGHSITVNRVCLENAQETWKTQISVKWPRELTVAALAPTKKESLLQARSLMCAALKELRIFDDKVFEAPHNLSKQPATAPQVPTTHPCGKDLGLPSDSCPEINGNVRGAASTPVCNEGPTFVPSLVDINRAKSLLHNIYAYISQLKLDDTLMPSYATCFGQSNKAIWETVLRVRWPCELAFKGQAPTKSRSESLAAAALVEYLVRNGHVDRTLSPRSCSDSQLNREAKLLKSQRSAPVPVALPADCVHDMRDIVDRFEAIVLNASKGQEEEEFLGCDTENCIDDTSGKSRNVRDIMTGRFLTSRSEHLQISRDRQLLGLQRNSGHFDAVRRGLPIFAHREEIVRMVEDNQVVVLCGETGSGKTTQVPQYIFEEYIQKGVGSSCNIVVTQPRRIATISMARRVASERGEQLGETVGFQVRLNKQLLPTRGGVLFCTVGILLRHLQENPSLQGLSHVIVDEVHERDVCTDFLLVLLRKVLEGNSTLKVVLMSATIDAGKFSEYFGGAPIIAIPGKIHPVTQYFLEDLSAANVVSLSSLPKNPADTVRLVPDVVVYLMRMKPPGAILCFLPGWNEINKVRLALCKLVPPQHHEWILPLHSRLHYSEQQRIFATPPPGVRKVILSTNLAETSITVDDVVYVVDAGLQREQRFNLATGVTLLGTFPTSQSSTRQRVGRAGRLRSGEAYHLYTREDLGQRDLHVLPEMQTTGLTRVLLDCKLFCPNMKVEDVLSLAPDPPSPKMIAKAGQDLQAMGMMDASGELTDLGHYVVHFGTAPQLAKAVIYAAMFGCLDPVVSIAALLSESANLFTGVSCDGVNRGKQVKLNYESTRTSDHAALSQIYVNWLELEHADDQAHFCRTNALNPFCLELSKGLGEELVASLMRGLLEDSGWCDGNSPPGRRKWGLELNSRLDSDELVYGVLAASLYPHVLRIMQGKLKNKVIVPNGVEFVCLDNKRAAISEDSLLHRVPPTYEHPWLVYFSALQPSEYQLTTVYDSTMVTSLHLLFFAGREVDMIEDYVYLADTQQAKASGQACLLIDRQSVLAFRCSMEDADLICRWRRMVDYMLALHLSLHRSEYCSPEETVLRQEIWPKVVDATARVLSRHRAMAASSGNCPNGRVE